jgi:AcrR family transcriptional regulator
MDVRGWNTAVAAELRAERARHQMTVHDLALRSGVNPTTLQRYLADMRRVEEQIDPPAGH